MIVAKIGQPVPAEDAFDTNNDVLDEGKDQFKKSFRVGFNVHLNHNFAFVVQDADIHFPGVQIDTAIVFVLLVVKFHGSTQRPRFLGRP